MDRDAVAANGEVVGAGAVVITLLFVPSQLRQNTKALLEEKLANLVKIVVAIAGSSGVVATLGRDPLSEWSNVSVTKRLREARQ